LYSGVVRSEPHTYRQMAAIEALVESSFG
jgi:hypothetical protein